MTERNNKPNGKQIYEALRTQILTLELEPGSKLDEFSLADTFGVSRSPIRNAVARLSAEGLVRTVGNRSIVSRLMGYETFPQYVDALDLVQRAVTRIAACQATEDDLARIRRANKVYLEAVRASDLRTMPEANKAFHLTIADVAGNQFMTHHYENLLDEGQRLMHVQFDFLMAKHGRSIGDDHDPLIRAIAAHDAMAAEKAAHEHALLFRNRFIEYLKQQQAHQIAVDFQLATEGVNDE